MVPAGMVWQCQAAALLHCAAAASGCHLKRRTMQAVLVAAWPSLPYTASTGLFPSRLLTIQTVPAPSFAAHRTGSPDRGGGSQSRALTGQSRRRSPARVVRWDNTAHRHRQAGIGSREPMLPRQEVIMNSLPASHLCAQQAVLHEGLLLPERCCHSRSSLLTENNRYKQRLPWPAAGGPA